MALSYADGRNVKDDDEREVLQDRHSFSGASDDDSVALSTTRTVGGKMIRSLS